jgi:hypothetical protein
MRWLRLIWEWLEGPLPAPLAHLEAVRFQTFPAPEMIRRPIDQG